MQLTGDDVFGEEADCTVTRLKVLGGKKATRFWTDPRVRSEQRWCCIAQRSVVATSAL